MARPSPTSKDTPPTGKRAQAIADRQQRKDAEALRAQFAGKTFADLLPGEKDDLLKAIAIRLGILDS